MNVNTKIAAITDWIDAAQSTGMEAVNISCQGEQLSLTVNDLKVIRDQMIESIYATRACEYYGQSFMAKVHLAEIAISLFNQLHFIYDIADAIDALYVGEISIHKEVTGSVSIHADGENFLTLIVKEDLTGLELKRDF
jgi:hypothetical protein